MRAEPLLLALSLALGACTTGRIHQDLAEVRRMTRAELPRDLARSAVRDETDDAVREILRRPLDADAAVRVALSNNRALRATLRELGIPRGRLLQAGTVPNPSVMVDLRQSTDPTQPLQVDIEVEYDLTGAILAPLRADVARSELDAARVRAAGEVIAVGYRVRAAYYRAQAARQRLAIAQQALDTFAAARDAARSLLAAGNRARIDLASREAAYQRERITVAQAELTVLTANEHMQRLLGLSGDDTRWQLAGALRALPESLRATENTERAAVEASLELREARARLEALARRTGLYRARGALPEISIDAHAEQDNQFWEIGGGVRVSLPIFDRQQGNLRAAEAEFDGLRERYVGTAIDLRSAARETVGRLRLAHARARQWRDVIAPARARVMEETQLQYNAMQLGVFQLLTARREQLDAELEAIDALRDYWISAAAMDALLAGWRVDVETDSSTSARGTSDAAAH
jgi:cobalt-zinc-cadmium efflux system outer membrane protein